MAHSFPHPTLVSLSPFGPSQSLKQT